jgi:drug/metabolite transporter (DMT)-like permease
VAGARAALRGPAGEALSLVAGLGGRPRSAALLGALAIAFSGIFYRWSGVSPATGVLFRCLFGLPILVLVARAEVRTRGPMGRRTVAMSVLAGMFFAVDLVTFHVVVDLMGAGLATVMGNLQVVIVALAAWLLLGERPRREVFVAIPVMLGGVVLISGIIGAEAYGADPRAGVAIGLVTAVSYAGYLLVIRRASPDHRPAGPVAIATAVTGLLGGLFGVAVGNLDLTPGWPAFGFLVAYGVVSQSIGYVAIQSALPRLPAVISSVLLLAQPVATLVLGVLLLGEDPSGAQLAGVLLVVGGIGLATGVPGRLAAAAGLRGGAAPGGPTPGTSAS